MKCDCSERIIIYESQLIRGKPLYCDLCGHEFSRQEIREKSEIVYEIDKKEQNLGYFHPQELILYL